jgi:hypothetical protein
MIQKAESCLVIQWLRPLLTVGFFHVFPFFLVTRQQIEAY